MSRLKKEQKKIEPIELSQDLFVIHIFPEQSIYVYAFRDYTKPHISVPIYRWFWNNSIQQGSQRTLQECIEDFYKYYGAIANIKFID